MDFAGLLQRSVAGVDPISEALQALLRGPQIQVRAPDLAGLPIFTRQPAGPQTLVQQRAPSPPNVQALQRQQALEALFSQPQTISGKPFSDRTFYHGSGSADMTPETVDALYGDPASLMGKGFYMTDSPAIAQGYANARGRRTKTPTVYRGRVNVGNVVDLEAPITPDVRDAIYRAAYNEFKPDILEAANKPGATPESVLHALQNAVSSESMNSMIPKSEYDEMFADIALGLKQAGYDALTHTGGKRTNNPPHKVLIILDPNDMAQTGRTSQITQLTPLQEAQLRQLVHLQNFVNAQRAKQAPIGAT